MGALESELAAGLASLGMDPKEAADYAESKSADPHFTVPESVEIAEVLGAISQGAEPLIREAADSFYERLMGGVQDYLADNVRFNLSSRISTLEWQVRFYRARWPMVVEALRASRDALRNPDVPSWKELALRKADLALSEVDRGASSRPAQTPDDGAGAEGDRRNRK